MLGMNPTKLQIKAGTAPMPCSTLTANVISVKSHKMMGMKYIRNIKDWDRSSMSIRKVPTMRRIITGGKANASFESSFPSKGSCN